MSCPSRFHWICLLWSTLPTHQLRGVRASFAVCEVENATSKERIRLPQASPPIIPLIRAQYTLVRSIIMGDWVVHISYTLSPRKSGQSGSRNWTKQLDYARLFKNRTRSSKLKLSVPIRSWSLQWSLVLPLLPGITRIHSRAKLLVLYHSVCFSLFPRYIMVVHFFSRYGRWSWVSGYWMC